MLKLLSKIFSVTSIIFIAVGCPTNESSHLESRDVRIYASISPGQLADAEIYKEIFGSSFNVSIIKTNGSLSDDSLTKPQKELLVNLFIEHVYDVEATKYAAQNWLMVNQEWVDSPESLKNIDVVLCKSILAAQLMTEYAKKYRLKFKVYYTKFTSIASLLPVVGKNYNLALHAAGKSPLKNTAVVLDAWLNKPKYPQLNVTCRDFVMGGNDGCFSKQALPLIQKLNIPEQKGIYHFSSNLTLYNGFIDNNELEKWQDNSGYYIVPSAVEGYGHYINEGRAKGAVIITTDSSPMSELVEDGVSGFLVPTQSCYHFNQYTNAMACNIDKKGLQTVVKKAIALTKNEKVAMGEKAQAAFIADKEFLTKQMKRLIALTTKGKVATLPQNPFEEPTPEFMDELVKVACNGVMLKTGSASIPSSPKIDQTYVINLNRSKQRLVGMCNEFHNARMQFNRFSAVNGKEMGFTAEKLEQEGIYKPLPLISDKTMTPGEFGIYYSHYNILKDIVEHKYETAMIFEDDARFGDEMKTNLETVMENAPKDWDMIFLGCREGEPNGADPEKLKHTKSFHLQINGEQKNATFLRADGATTTAAHGYIVNQKMAQLLVDNLMPIQGPIDLVMQILFIGTKGETSKFGPRKAYCVHPELAIQSKSEPSIIEEFGRVQ